MKENRQRLVLIVGAVAVLFAMASAPKYQVINGTRFPANTSARVDNYTDLGTGMFRVIAVLCATGLAWYALKPRT